MDMELPDGNGLDICQRLRSHGFQTNYHAYGPKDDGDIVKGLDKGASDYIAKPIRFGELFSWYAHICANIKHQMR